MCHVLLRQGAKVRKTAVASWNNLHLRNAAHARTNSRVQYFNSLSEGDSDQREGGRFLYKSVCMEPGFVGYNSVHVDSGYTKVKVYPYM